MKRPHFFHAGANSQLNTLSSSKKIIQHSDSFTEVVKIAKMTGARVQKFFCFTLCDNMLENSWPKLKFERRKFEP